MSLQGKDLLNELFGWPGWGETRAEKAKKLVRNRPETVHRPERSTKAGFTGRTKGLTGRDQTGELQPKEVGGERARVNEFDSEGDFLLSMIMVALMHVNPDLTPEEAIEQGRDWAKRMWTPNKKHVWRKQAMRIKRHGVRAEASKIRREMFKLL